MPSINSKQAHLYRLAGILVVLTVVYNLIEGLISVYFGARDEALTLFGFGIDSFVETISALGVAHMILRMRRNPDVERGHFEKQALRITGWCFYLLAALLTVTAILSVIYKHQPESTLSGLIIAIVSIVAMWVLIRFKLDTGKQLQSAPIIADARCNIVCLYMSIILLLASALWWMFRIPYVDAVGAIGLVYFSINEGKEAFEKASRG